MRRMFVVAATGFCLLACAWLYRRGGRAPELPSAETFDGSAPSTALHASVSPSFAGDTLAPPAAPTDDVLAKWSLPRRKERVFARRPELQRFVDLKAKVLRSEEENNEYAALLAEEARMKAAKEDLLATSEKHFDETFQLQRIYQVTFLDAALSWKDNPSHAQALSVVEDVLRTQSDLRALPVDLVKSVSGDRIELVISLLGNAPDRERALRDEVRGTSLERVFVAGERRAAMANIEGPAQAP